jgi:hypothetical protein
MRELLAVDFDGTITPDGVSVFPGCVETLSRLIQRFEIGIFSARITDSEREQMKQTLDKNGVPYDRILERKPNAFRFIDDRGVTFKSWPQVESELS